MPCLSFFKKLYTWFLPPTCILCKHLSDRSADLCQLCLDELPILPQSCPRCANPITAQDGNLICGGCLKNPPPFDATYALYSYEPPLTKFIMGLKFHEHLIYAKILGGLMAIQLKHVWYHTKNLPDVILPMPLHPIRLRTRGFNQALELARPIAHFVQLPIDVTSCVRIKNTAAQARLSVKKRTDNIKNAFLINRDLSGLHIALVDDVITTGHTIAECSRALKNAGARQVDVWCCAKTPRFRLGLLEKSAR